MFNFFKNKITLDESCLLKEGFSYDLASKYASFSKDDFIKDLTKSMQVFAKPEDKPYIHMFVGSNGVGKSSTIGKIASLHKATSQSVMLVAGDTFRAAATEQLTHYAHLLDIPIFSQHQNADPASVIFDGIKKGKDADILLVDTSGRLNTKTHLINELERCHKTAEKAAGKPISQISLVLDATNGLHLLTQVEDFLKAIPITDIIFTKTDNNKNLGTIINVIKKFDIPISYLCFGEKLENIATFDKEEFIKVIADLL